MKIKGWAIYKTPTTFYAPPNPSTGHNTWNYHDFLFQTFSKHYGNYNDYKGVKVNGDTLTITIPHELPVPMDYNILEITKSDSTRVYYVITGYVSNNDGNSPSMTITGTFDPWQNYISNKPYGFVWGNDEDAFVTTGTLPLWENASTPVMRIDGDAPNITHIMSVTPKNPVIWAVIRTDVDPNFMRCADLSTTPHTFTNIIRTVVQREDLTPVIYVPVGILVTSNNIRANMAITTLINGKIAHTYDRNQLDIRLYRFTSTHILSVEYTTQPPFTISSYEYDSSNRTLNVKVSETNYNIGYAAIEDELKPGTYDYIYEGNCVVGRKSQTITGTTQQFTETNKPTLNTSAKTISGQVQENLYHPVLKQMPYDFKVLKCGDIILPVSYDNWNGGGVSVTMFVDSLDTVAPFVVPQRSGNRNLEYGKVISPGAQAITRQDRTDLYNRNSGASEAIARNLQSLKTVMGLGTGITNIARATAGDVSSAINAVSGIGNTIASQYSFDQRLIGLHQDLTNQQDVFSIPSAVGEERLQFLDQVNLITYQMTDNREKKNALTRLHRYGFGCSQYHPLKQNRVWFDFYKCAEIHANAVTNEAHREYIESQFLSGVRVWYWYSGYSSTNPAISCDLTRNNPDVTIAQF